MTDIQEQPDKRRRPVSPGVVDPGAMLSPKSLLQHQTPQQQQQQEQQYNQRTRPQRPRTPGVEYRRLPSDFINCRREDMITVVARMLVSLIRINDKQSATQLRYIEHERLTRFHSRSPPGISVYQYLSRLARYSSLEPCVLITAVYYIDLLTLCYPVFALNSLTVHRFLLTATTVGSKSLCDSFCSNHHYAKVGGVNSMELDLLEAEFLTKVNYRVVPRDFNGDMGERRSSTGTLDSASTGHISPRGGISCAAEVLFLYYRRMVMLVGGIQPDGDDHNSIMVGFNDNVVYFMTDDDADSNKGDARGESYEEREPSTEYPQKAVNQYYGNGYVDSSTDYDSSDDDDRYSRKRLGEDDSDRGSKAAKLTSPNE